MKQLIPLTIGHRARSARLLFAAIATSVARRAMKHTAYELHVQLRYIEPPIWRTLEVPGSATLEDVHYAIQYAMGWEKPAKKAATASPRTRKGRRHG